MCESGTLNAPTTLTGGEQLRCRRPLDSLTLRGPLCDTGSARGVGEGRDNRVPRAFWSAGGGGGGGGGGGVNSEK
jgi:hypothetical protein